MDWLNRVTSSEINSRIDLTYDFGGFSVSGLYLTLLIYKLLEHSIREREDDVCRFTDNRV